MIVIKADYWNKRTIVYDMGNDLSTIYICLSSRFFLSNIGPDEYFYKKTSRGTNGNHKIPKNSTIIPNKQHIHPAD